MMDPDVVQISLRELFPFWLIFLKGSVAFFITRDVERNRGFLNIHREPCDVSVDFHRKTHFLSLLSMKVAVTLRKKPVEILVIFF